jgi:hypothetical protein
MGLRDSDPNKAEREVKPKSTDPWGDPEILRMHHAFEIRMGEELTNYDLVIVHYFNEDIQGKSESDKF